MDNVLVTLDGKGRKQRIVLSSFELRKSSIPIRHGKCLTASGCTAAYRQNDGLTVPSRNPTSSFPMRQFPDENIRDWCSPLLLDLWKISLTRRLQS